MIQSQKVRHPRTAVEFEWDENNEPKLAVREIRPADVEALFWQGGPEWRRSKASGTGDWFMIGRDAAGTRPGVGWS